MSSYETLTFARLAETIGVQPGTLINQSLQAGILLAELALQARDGDEPESGSFVQFYDRSAEAYERCLIHPPPREEDVVPSDPLLPGVIDPFAEEERDASLSLMVASQFRGQIKEYAGLMQIPHGELINNSIAYRHRWHVTTEVVGRPVLFEPIHGGDVYELDVEFVA